MCIEKKFGQRIREIRENQGISQEQFALKIGLDRTYYNSVENGRRNVSIRNISKIAEGFNITISELFSTIR